MNVVKVEFYFINHDEMEIEEIEDVVKFVHYPNHCISPNIMSIESRDIGEWHDGHPLNHVSTADLEVKKLFDNETCGSTHI